MPEALRVRNHHLASCRKENRKAILEIVPAFKAQFENHGTVGELAKIS